MLLLLIDNGLHINYQIIASRLIIEVIVINNTKVIAINNNN